MDNNQIQLKLSLSTKLNILLKARADKLGIPSTQLVKYLIIKEVENDNSPKYEASDRTNKKAIEALDNLSSSKTVENISDFFNDL